jgi:hypothetical protein
MLCGKCGALNPNSRAFCKSCGSSLWPTVKAKAPAGALAAAGHAPSLIETQGAGVQRPPISPELPSVDFSGFYGVRGWLLLFCISQTIIGPVVVLAEAAKSKSFPTIAIDLGLTALSIYTGVALWRRRTNSFRWLKAYFLVLLTFAVLGLLASIILRRSYLERDLSINPVLGGCIRTVASVIIWWAYFKKSKRVRATYGRNL